MRTKPFDAVVHRARQRGMTMQDVATCVGLSKSHISLLKDAKRPITPQIAMKLGAAMDVDPVLILHAQNKYSIAKLKSDKKLMRQIAKCQKF